jgi:hypothetical protein
MPPLKLFPSTRALIQVGVLLVILGGGSLVLALTGPAPYNYYFGWGGVLVFGGGFGAVMWTYRTKPTIVITDGGVEQAGSMPPPGLRWDQIVGVRVRTLPGSRMLEIVPNDDVDRQKLYSGLMGSSVARNNRRFGYADVNISERLLPISLEGVIEELRKRHDTLVVLPPIGPRAR